MNKYLLFLVLFVFSGLLFANDKKKDNSDKEEKKESFINYFNFIPKVTKEFTCQDDFLDYSGLVVRNINIHVFDRYSKQLSKINLDTVNIENKENLNPNQKLVKRQLLFKEGDLIDAALFADAERYLRENTIYTDAVIEIIPSADCVYADINVFVIDNRHWRAVFWASPESITTGIQLEDFAGLPQSLLVYGSGLFSKNNPYQVGIEYGVNNIKRSQIDLKASYDRQNIENKVQLLLKKDFNTYNTKWAGKINLLNTSRKETESGFADDISPHYNMGLIKKDVWLARSFPMPKLFPDKKSMRFIVSARSTINHFYKTPENLPIQNYVNKQFYLGSFGIANRAWFGFEELYRFRDYDYLPKGFNLAILGGYEVNEFLGPRFYNGVTANYSYLYEKIGYLQQEIKYGAFIRDGNYEQITTQFNLNYFTNEAKLGRYGFRQFVKTSTTLSYNRPSTEFFSFSNEIRGLNSNNINMFGTKSMILNLESVLYTPIEWWTGKGNLFLFADIGYISSNERKSLFRSPIHQGYGVGIRFQHLITSINYLQISFGYYPNGQLVGVSPIRVDVSGKPDRMIEPNNLFDAGILTD